MTVVIKYELPRPRVASDWQVDMAKQIENNRGSPLKDIDREVSGTTLTVRVDTSLPSKAVKNMPSDIEDYIPAASQHVETREI